MSLELLNSTSSSNSVFRVVCGEMVLTDKQYLHNEAVFGTVRSGSLQIVIDERTETLSEGTIYSEKGLSSVPIKVSGTKENDMVGCIHQLRNVHVKNSTKEFVKMMKESAVLLRDTLLSEEV